MLLAEAADRIISAAVGMTLREPVPPACPAYPTIRRG